MPKWLELLLAGVVGAVLPIVGAALWLGGELASLKYGVEANAGGLNRANGLLERIGAREDSVRRLEDWVQHAANATVSADAQLLHAERVTATAEAKSARAERLASELVDLLSEWRDQINSIDLSAEVAVLAQNPEFRSLIAAAIQPIPRYAVVAFDSGTGCPDGWTEVENLRGRFIVGAGQNEDQRLSERPYGQPGGEEEVTLTTAELPSHEHGNAGGLNVAYLPNGGLTLNLSPVGSGNPGWGFYPLHLGPWQAGVGPALMETAGSGEDHNNMPPYIALYWCTPE